MGETLFLCASPSFLEGASRILDFAGAVGEYNRSLTPEQADCAPLRQDWRAIGEDVSRAMQTTVVTRKGEDSDIKKSYLGLAAGFIVVMTGLIGGIVLIGMGHEVAGSTIGGTSLVGLGGVFVYGTATRKEERERKAKIMAGGQDAQARGGDKPHYRYGAAVGSPKWGLSPLR